MTKLDDIILVVMAQEQDGDTLQKDIIDEAKQQIKDLFLELIPETVDSSKYRYEDSAQDFMLGYVQACIEITRKVAEL